MKNKQVIEISQEAFDWCDEEACLLRESQRWFDQID